MTEIYIYNEVVDLVPRAWSPTAHTRHFLKINSRHKSQMTGNLRPSRGQILILTALLHIYVIKLYII